MIHYCQNSKVMYMSKQGNATGNRARYVGKRQIIKKLVCNDTE